MSKLIWVEVYSSQESFQLRLLCVTTSSSGAGATFLSTSSGTSPTFIFYTAQADCITSISCNCLTNLMAGTAGIAAKNYLHVKQYPDKAAYYDYYDIVMDISEVGVEDFATLVQEMLVYYLCNK